MQLTNIARDVGEDARIGRLYLPRAWLREAGIDPGAFLANPRFDAPLAGVVARLLDQADILYRRADEGISGLRPAFRPAIFAARHLYAEIGHLLRRRGLDSVSRRTCVSTTRKLWLLTRAARSARTRVSAPENAPPLAETRYLVEAVTGETGRLPPGGQAGPRRLRDDLIWTIDLFSSLETRHRVLGSAG
jgi:phytoene synthase